MGTIVNKSDFEKLFDGMRRNVRTYENWISDYDVDLYLADGRKIKYCVPNFCVPHLLGVNINYLESTGLFEKQNAYSLLKEMLANGYRVYSNIVNGVVDYNRLFSEHVAKKVDNFEDNVRINVKDSVLVCEYKKDRTYANNDYSFEFDYIIVKKIADGTYLMLGLKNNGYDYAPMTSQAYDSLESLNEKLSTIIKNQKITFISRVGYGNGKSFYLYVDDKIKRVNSLKYYANEFDAIVDVSGDYVRNLDHTKNNRSRGGNMSFAMASSIIDNLGDGKIITPEILGFSSFDDIDPNISSVIIQINNLIVSGTSGGNLENFSYSELLNLRKACDDYRTSTGQLQEKIDSLSDVIQSQEDTINSLAGENESLKEAQRAAVKILLPNENK